ncbi:MAG: flagellin [Terracidiphilus sp.]|nr:flagellin [Terracidiphilus sp.]
MSLGVLNNLNAMYASNNLSNTNASLSKTLQQLSSGSKINSGADDAAGLSLVNGLAANSTALTQSATNATEGVGLLQVADGALSQVTNLLNRAVTLATEVSNGTLNSSQQSAANQEYQSILSEINNIGSTTTYNQRNVFNSQTQIYTGDSSSTGSSIDQLNIGTLSSSSVGQTAGTMSYSSGSSVFIDLSNSGTKNAQSTDTIAAGSQLAITYVVGKDQNGTAITATATISTGGTTGYANTVDGMVQAINNSGLGVSASFGTAAQAGASGATAQTDTGIVITGNVTTAAPTAVGQVEVAAGGTALADSTSGGTTAYDAGASGIATIGYTASSGTDLSSTTLTSTSHAQAALTALNSAIANVAAQDGYIGAQINTLTSIGQVISTQQQNIVAAQNAVQATDYATASSNLSKYEILSQTGISALAQANSLQQEVTKLLQ